MHGVEVADDDLTAISKEMDLNKDGFVSLSEFAHAICGGFEELTPEEARARQTADVSAKTKAGLRRHTNVRDSKGLRGLGEVGLSEKSALRAAGRGCVGHALDVTENDAKECFGGCADHRGRRTGRRGRRRTGSAVVFFGAYGILGERGRWRVCGFSRAVRACRSVFCLPASKVFVVFVSFARVAWALCGERR